MMHLSSTNKWTRRQLVLSVVTFVYLLSTICLQYKSCQKAVPFLSRPFAFFGLLQHWGFFAPTPDAAHSIVGVITLDNGAKILWEPPHPSSQDSAHKAQLNRYVKWETEMVVDRSYFPLLSKLSKHVCGQFYFQGKAHPLSCAFFDQSSETPKYDKKFLPRDSMKRSYSMAAPIDYQKFQPEGQHVD